MEVQSKPKIIVVVGPTGSGKTALSIELAKHYSGEVISADSRQVYTGLDIGTEKVSKEEMFGVPHHLIDILPPTEVYTVHAFVKDAAALIEEITAHNHLPIITGGTFFYVDSLLGKSGSAQVEPDQALRSTLEQKTNEELFAELQQKDPRRAETIEPQNKRRLVRALEVVASLGAVPPLTLKSCPYDVLTIGLNIDKKTHREKLAKRAHSALNRGLMDEIQRALAAGVSKERLSEIGLEYRETLAYLDGSISYERMLERFTEVNWQYAKRQLTWLKRDSSIEWFFPEDTEAISKRVGAFLAQ
jgi:tRNA dimethylallyltransferase